MQCIFCAKGMGTFNLIVNNISYIVIFPIFLFSRYTTETLTGEIMYCAKVVCHSAFLYVLLSFKVVTSISSEAFWRSFKVFLWTSAAFSLIFSPDLVPDTFEKICLFFFFFLLSNWRLTYKWFKHKKASNSSDRPMLFLLIKTQMSKDTILNRIIGLFVISLPQRRRIHSLFICCIYEKCRQQHSLTEKRGLIRNVPQGRVAAKKLFLRKGRKGWGMPNETRTLLSPDLNIIEAVRDHLDREQNKRQPTSKEEPWNVFTNLNAVSTGYLFMLANVSINHITYFLFPGNIYRNEGWLKNFAHCKVKLRHSHPLILQYEKTLGTLMTYYSEEQCSNYIV